MSKVTQPGKHNRPIGRLHGSKGVQLEVPGEKLFSFPARRTVTNGDGGAPIGQNSNYYYYDYYYFISIVIIM